MPLSIDQLNWSPIPSDIDPRLWRRAYFGDVEGELPEGVLKLDFDIDLGLLDISDGDPRMSDELEADDIDIEEFLQGFVVKPESLQEVAIHLYLSRIPREDLPEFWGALYAACSEGAMVTLFDVPWNHRDFHSDVTRVAGFDPRTLHYLNPKTRAAISRDPYEDSTGIQAFEGIDFETKTVMGIFEPQYEGRADETRTFMAQSHNNCVWRYKCQLQANKRG